MASPCSFSKKNSPIMPLDQNPHQTLTRFGCVGFSMYACGFSVPKMWQFCLFTYPPGSKWASSEKMISFFAKIGRPTERSEVQAYTQPYSFGRRIKLIICQIKHELSVTIHEISTSWNKTFDGGPYVYFQWVTFTVCWTFTFVKSFVSQNQETNLLVVAINYGTQFPIR